jgi:hypothetical protein
LPNTVLVRKQFTHGALAGLLSLGLFGTLAVTTTNEAGAAGAAVRAATKTTAKAKAKAKPKPAPAKSTKATPSTVKPPDPPIPVGTAGSFIRDVKWTVRLLTPITPMTGRWVGSAPQSEPGKQWYSILTEFTNNGSTTESFRISEFGFIVGVNVGLEVGSLRFEDDVDGVPNCKQSSNVLYLAPGATAKCFIVVQTNDAEADNYFLTMNSYEDRLVRFRIR